MPTPPTITPIPNMEIQDAHRLLKALNEIDSEPNILTLEEFRRYAPLYVRPTVVDRPPTQNKALSDLAIELQQRLNIYKPTHIVRSKSDRTVLLRLPQIHTPIRTMSPTEKNERAVTTNYNHRNSDLPKVWSTAQNTMTIALFEEQNDPSQIELIAKTRQETDEIISDLVKVYNGGTLEQPETIKTIAAPTLPSDQFDDV